MVPCKLVNHGMFTIIVGDIPTEEKIDIADAAVLEIRLALQKESEGPEKKQERDTHRLHSNTGKPTEAVNEAVLQLAPVAITNR